MRESSKCKEARSDSAGEQVGGGSGGANHHTVNAAGSAGPGWGMSRGASEGWRRLASEGSLESSKCEQVPYQNLHALETLWISLMCPSSSSYAGATSSFCGTGLVCSAEAQVKKMKEHAIAGAGGEDGDGAGVGERQELGHVSASHAARMRERQGTCESQEPLHRERAGHVIEENKGFKGAGTCMDARRNKGASFVENVESEILVGRVFEGGMGVMERMYLRMLESEDREYDSMLARSLSVAFTLLLFAHCLSFFLSLTLPPHTHSLCLLRVRVCARALARARVRVCIVGLSICASFSLYLPIPSLPPLSTYVPLLLCRV
jgi:hypothetical protein